jgi:hypothetical protein
MDDFVTELPKVERIVSSTPVSVSYAAAFISKFVIEQKRKPPSSSPTTEATLWSSPLVSMTAVDHTVWDDLKSIAKSMKQATSAVSGVGNNTLQQESSVEPSAAAAAAAPSEKDSDSKGRMKESKKKSKKSKAEKKEKRKKKRKQEDAEQTSEPNQKEARLE